MKLIDFPRHLFARFLSGTLVTFVILCCQFDARMGYFAWKIYFKGMIKNWEKMKSYNSQHRTFFGLVWLWCCSSGRLGAFRDINNVDPVLFVKYFQEGETLLCCRETHGTNLMSQKEEIHGELWPEEQQLPRHVPKTPTQRTSCCRLTE